LEQKVNAKETLNVVQVFWDVTLCHWVCSSCPLEECFFFSGCSPRRITMQKDRVYYTDVDDDGGRAERG